MRRILLSIGLLLSLLPSNAQIVDETTAQQRALSFLSSGRPRRVKGQQSAKKVKLAHTSQGKKGNNYYAFNVGDGEGFVLIAAEERAEEVLGYAEKGTFDYASIPANVKWWLSQYDEQIEAVRAQEQQSNSQSSASSSKALSAASAMVRTSQRHDIEPMITTQWDQVPPYNSQIPALGPDYGDWSSFATGCIATALSQIMNFYQYPTHGVGSNAYTIDYGTGEPLLFSADFANTTYHWDLMKPYYDGSETPAEKEAIGTLLYHVGVANNMEYMPFTEGGSSAIIQHIPYAMINYFDYDKSTTCEDRSWYTTAAWERMVYEELAAGRPVLYSGITPDFEGHTFICHGYRASDNHFLINWGWSGYCDGYFLLTATPYEEALKPNGTGSGGGAEGVSYSSIQLVEKNLFPNKGGNFACRIISDGEFTIGRNEGNNGDVIQINGNFFNLSLVEQSLAFGVALEDVNTLTRHNLTSFVVNDLPPNYGYNDYNVQLRDIPDGHYRVIPVYYELDKPDQWTDMLTAQLHLPIITVGNPGVLAPVGTGDVNGDGVLTITDATLIIEYYLDGGHIPAGFHTSAADVNNDGTIDAEDVRMLVELLLGR